MSDTIDKSLFAKRLEYLRERNGWSKTYMANKLGIKNMQQYANWEYGTREPDNEMVINIASIFDVSTDYLLGKTDKKNKEYWELTEKDEQDVQKTLEDMMDGLSNDDSLAFMKNGGEELDDDDAALLRASLEQTIALSKQLAKKKFTRKDLRDKE